MQIMKIPLKLILFFLGLIALFQLFFLHKMSLLSTRNSSQQCNCQCADQMLLRLGGNAEVEEEEQKERRIIQMSNRRFHNRNGMEGDEAEDEDDDEDYDEVDQHQPEDSDSREVPKPTEIFIYSPPNYDPAVNASSFTCNQSSQSTILMYCYSAPGNFEMRQTVRNTYGSVKEYEGLRLQILFFIGGLRSDADESLRYQLLNESKTHGDLVQDHSFIDAYRNLTLKGISALQWVSAYCPNVFRVMKIDDDTIVNPFHLVEYLRVHDNETNATFICKTTRDVGPVRNKTSKFFVSYADYPDDDYPEYCQGYGYIIPPKLVPVMLKRVQEVRIIAMEDVFFTGLVPQGLDVKIHHLYQDRVTIFTRLDRFMANVMTRWALILVGHVHEKRHAQIVWEIFVTRHQADVAKEAAKRKRKEKARKIEDENNIVPLNNE